MGCLIWAQFVFNFITIIYMNTRVEIHVRKGYASKSHFFLKKKWILVWNKTSLLKKKKKTCKYIVAFISPEYSVSNIIISSTVHKNKNFYISEKFEFFRWINRLYQSQMNLINKESEEDELAGFHHAL